MASSMASGCHLGSFEATEETSAHLGPWDCIDGARLQLPDAPLDFSIPRLICLFVGSDIQAFDKGTGERCAIGFAHRKRLLQQFIGSLAHTLSIPRTLMSCFDTVRCLIRSFVACAFV